MDSNPRARRHRLKLTAGEIGRFLRGLAETGNATLAAERVGRHRSTFVKRCGRDPVFAARCGAAIAEFRLSAAVRPSLGKAAGAGAILGQTAAPLKCARGELLLARGRKRPAQIRRAGGGELTQAGIDAFLRSLAATANLRLSAESVGVRPNAIRQRRLRDPAFARAVRDALQAGYERLEAALLDSAIRCFESGEEDEPAAGGSGLPPMTVDAAMMLLAQHRRTCREGWETRRARRSPASWEDVELYFARELRRLGIDPGEDV